MRTVLNSQRIFGKARSGPLIFVKSRSLPLIGYAFLKLGCEPAPLLLGLILGPTMEDPATCAAALAG
jgi:hypothetical protein